MTIPDANLDVPTLCFNDGDFINIDDMSYFGFA